MGSSGGLLDAVARRILARYLKGTGATGVMIMDEAATPHGLSGVDLVYTRDGVTRRVKVKPDPYFGVDAGRVADMSLPFYREAGSAYAFETIAHHVTRDPGWMFNSVADELFYYFVAIDQAEEDVAALLGEADGIFFGELSVVRDELHIFEMVPLREWFERNNERYMPRPVRLGDHSGWYRIVPEADLPRAVAPVQVKGPIFSAL